MAIKFDTLEELKAFCQHFRLMGQSVNMTDAPKKRGRKPGSKNKATLPLAADKVEMPKKRGRKPKLQGAMEATSVDAPKKRGRKPATQILTPVAGSGKKRGRKPGSASQVKSIVPAKRGRKPSVGKTS